MVTRAASPRPRPPTIPPRVAKVQLCGRLGVEVDGRRVEGELPGRQGRLVLAFLARNRLRPLARSDVL